MTTPSAPHHLVPRAAVAPGGGDGAVPPPCGLATPDDRTGHPDRDAAGQARRDERGYSISEVAARSGLSAHTLRWYERIGLMPRVGRGGAGGRRRYSERDLDWLDFVGKLRLTGMPVADMVRYAELVRAGEHTFAERQQLLADHREQVRDRIAELQSCLLVVDHKINTYAEARRVSERKWASNAQHHTR